WDDVCSERDVNSAWSKWKELFLSVCNKHAPIRHKVLRGIICPWKARKTGSEVDWSLRIGYLLIKTHIDAVFITEMVILFKHVIIIII
ncbi:unnamed protein product, partial [Porites evermanni]